MGMEYLSITMAHELKDFGIITICKDLPKSIIITETILKVICTCHKSQDKVCTNGMIEKKVKCSIEGNLRRMF